MPYKCWLQADPKSERLPPIYQIAIQILYRLPGTTFAWIRNSVSTLSLSNLFVSES